MNLLALPSFSQRLRRRVTLPCVKQPAFVILSLVAVAAVTGIRLWYSFDLPLWLDETWTAVIATQPSWRLFGHEAWLDCNAPLYYIFERIWVSLVGTSNVALRLPSAIFLYLAAAVPLIWRGHGLDKQATIVWSTLLLLWWPGLMISLDARAYGLLLLISVCNLIAFIDVHRRISAASLVTWSSLSALLVLTHYYGFFLLVTQGAALAWKYRWELPRRWYALLPFAPALVWTLYHLPRLAAYARPDVVWYEPTTLETAPRYIVYTFGAPSPYFALMVVMALGGALWKSGWKFAPVDPSNEIEPTAARVTKAAILSGGSALLLILIASAFQASLAERYLVPIVPAMLLAVVGLAGRIRRKNLAYLLLVTVYMIFALVPGPLRDELQSRSSYGYETPSRFVALSNPSNLLFVWDHPATKILDKGSLEQIGSFFLRRDGINATTEALELEDGKDPNIQILQAVPNQRTAVIWLYNAKRRSGAGKFPPVLAKNKGWDCLDQRTYVKSKSDGAHDELEVGVIACRPLLKLGASK